ncbi:28S ribosomal protein S31, mitochondrial [Athalia rosae]|uniref:28S ribosomal protein S31, mitochondrial n=1 Tax=Athalia rosae TaxID=37344 RepID=UPI0020337B1E|nr:28S ribosomal protein S31, mitochondrial [Athalia rosae]XP_048513382.1 28S ribosomal protein S31, mitochondrial [Athalia rosae]XP_048513383.1 28S ribosomal protein S31, mitochondrial [Athalia rosae]
MKMISLRLLTRNVGVPLAASSQRLHTSEILFNSSSDSESSDDEIQKKKVAVPAKEGPGENSVHKINALLQSMTQPKRVQPVINVAIKRKPVKTKAQVKIQSVTQSLFDNKLAEAAKEAAASLGGDVNKTESELLNKLLATNKQNQESIDLSKLVKGMTVDRSKSTVESNDRADQVRAVMQKSKRHLPIENRVTSLKRQMQKNQGSNTSRVDIDSGTPMNLFPPSSESNLDPNTPSLTTWDLLESRELKLLVTHPPNNFIEQMIQWTEQRKLWRFPIDNEQDMHVDGEEHFSEHVFLEQHLEDWCPTKGPIRHFMELVCVGLSKNPWMSARDKEEHIMWFKEYFDKKQELLKELGIYGTAVGEPDKKQIEK